MVELSIEGSLYFGEGEHFRRAIRARRHGHFRECLHNAPGVCAAGVIANASTVFDIGLLVVRQAIE